MEPWLIVVSSVLGSSALFTFLQFMVQRRDKNRVNSRELFGRIDSIESKVDQLSEDIKSNDEKLRESMRKSQAIECRVRILQAADEIRCKKKHSKEWFDQLNEDITVYEKFCNAHPDFKNNKAIHAVAAINTVYARALETNDFL